MSFKYETNIIDIHIFAILPSQNGIIHPLFCLYKSLGKGV